MRLSSRLAGGILLWAALALVPGWARAELDLNDPETYRTAREYMLLIINQARHQAGAGSVRLDPLANKTARQHAADMLSRGYLSHWNPEGLKPTRRYNLLGGFHALGENVYFKHGPLLELTEMLDELLKVLLESPGHRETILDPRYTHVGLGFALNAAARDFYSAQEFIVRIGGDYLCPPGAYVGERVVFSGRFDPYRYELAHVVVGYEELPEPRDKQWLMSTGSYRDADKLVAGYTPQANIHFTGMDTYHDIEVDGEQGAFSCEALLNYKNRAGMYYLFLWLTDKRTKEAVHAATATVVVTR